MTNREMLKRKGENINDIRMDLVSEDIRGNTVMDQFCITAGDEKYTVYGLRDVSPDENFNLLHYVNRLLRHWLDTPVSEAGDHENRTSDSPFTNAKLLDQKGLKPSDVEIEYVKSVSYNRQIIKDLYRVNARGKEIGKFNCLRPADTDISDPSNTAGINKAFMYWLDRPVKTEKTVRIKKAEKNILSDDRDLRRLSRQIIESTLNGSRISFDDRFPHMYGLSGTERRSVLDKEERRYLRSFFAPFRNSVIAVIKDRIGTREYLKVIYMIDDTAYSSTPFPPFEAGSMYTGMEPGKKYTLKDLKLSD